MENCVKVPLKKNRRVVRSPKDSTSRARKPLELIYSNLCGPIQTKTRGDNLYFLLFIDDCTNFG